MLIYIIKVAGLEMIYHHIYALSKIPNLKEVYFIGEND